MARRRNYIGEAAGEVVVRLPKSIKKHVKPLIKQGQTRASKGKEDLDKKLSKWFWGKKK